MSYISQTPEVYSYNPGQTSSFQQPSNTYQFPLSSQQPTYYKQPTYNPPINTQTQPVNRYGQSQVNRVYEPISINYNKANTTPVSAPITNYQYTNNQVPIINQTVIQNEIRTNEVPPNRPQIQSSKNQQRFDNYLSQGDSTYKYNIFSVIDEPWNRCLQGKSCGSLPGNQCVASETFKSYWK